MAYEIVRSGKFKGSIPTVSVVANTFRSGGIDITLAGMRDQLYDKNRFEVILVDHRYEYRHKEVVALAKAYGIQNFTHVPEYQRNGKWCSFCSGWNTGFALSEGEITLTLCDYSYAPPQWINKHVVWHYDIMGRKMKRLAIGPHSVHTMPLPFLFHGSENDYQAWIANQQLHSGNNSITGGCIEQPDFGKVFGEISIFPNLFDPIEVNRTSTCPPPNQDPKLIYETGRCKREWMHVKNESCFTESIYEINGLDELFEYGKGPMDNEFGARFEYSGHELIFDRDNAIFCFDPRFLMSSMPWGDWNKNVEGRWAYFQGESYQNQRYNEFAKGAKPWAPNPYSLREKRRELLPWKKLEQITPDMIKVKPPCPYYPPFGVKANKDRNIPVPLTPNDILNKFVGQFVAVGDTVIDVGACIGEYTKVLADLVGDGGLVVAIEPGIKTYEKLCEDLGKCKNVNLYRKAISNKAGHAKLAHHKYWILLPEVPTEPYSEPDIPLKESALIDVDIVTLDDIYHGLSEQLQSRLSFIKIDVDGWEVKVLEGAEDLLSRVRPIIFIEISRYCIEKVGDKFEKAFEILWKHNYDVIAAPNLGVPALKEPLLIHELAEVVNLLDSEGVIGLDFICKPRTNISGSPPAWIRNG